MTSVRTIREIPANCGKVSRLLNEDWQKRGDGIVAGITTRRGAPSFGLSGAANAVEPLDAYRELAEELRMDGVSVVIQVHGPRVVHVPAPPPIAVACFGRADGMVTDGSRCLLAVTAADCVPIYLFDPSHRAIGLLHAGWRGAAAGVLVAGIAALGRCFGSTASNLLVHLGPSISGDRYEVGPEVLGAFGIESEGAAGLDIRDHLAKQALEAGVPSDRLTRSAWCTSTHSDLLHSHRASGGTAGRMAAFVGLK